MVGAVSGAFQRGVSSYRSPDLVRFTGWSENRLFGRSLREKQCNELCHGRVESAIASVDDTDWPDERWVIRRLSQWDLDECLSVDLPTQRRLGQDGDTGTVLDRLLDVLRWVTPSSSSSLHFTSSGVVTSASV